MPAQKRSVVWAVGIISITDAKVLVSTLVTPGEAGATQSVNAGLGKTPAFGQSKAALPDPVI